MHFLYMLLDKLSFVMKSCILSHILSLTEWKTPKTQMIRCPDGLQTKMGCQLFFLTYWRPFSGLRNSQVCTGMWQEMTAQDLELSLRTRILEIEQLGWPLIAHNLHLHLFICHAQLCQGTWHKKWGRIQPKHRPFKVILLHFSTLHTYA